MQHKQPGVPFACFIYALHLAASIKARIISAATCGTMALP
jgi:hypothetical protein